MSRNIGLTGTSTTQGLKTGLINLHNMSGLPHPHRDHDLAQISFNLAVTEIIPAISSLSADILWHIMSMNAHMNGPIRRHHHSPLTTIRHVSQVCKIWRQIVLESSSLWANVIDMTMLDQKEDHWRNLVIQRTKKAPLWIKGKVEHPGRLLLPLLSTEWARIRVLDVEIPRISDSDVTTDDKRWERMLQPAPLLENFTLIVDHRDHPGIFHGCTGCHSDATLFSDVAPSLLKISTLNMGFKISTRSNWLSHIRCLVLGHIDQLSTILYAFASQKSILLERLVLSGPPAMATPLEATVLNCSLPYINCPNLEFISIQHYPLPSSAQFMDHINPASGCALDLVGHVYNAVEQDLTMIQKVLMRYTRSCLERRPPDSLLLKNGYESMAFVARFEDMSSGVDNPPLRITLADRGTFGETYMAARLMLCSALNLDILSNIPKVELEANFNSEFTTDDRFYSLLRSLSSVKICKTDWETLAYFLSPNMVDRTLFPRLRSLQLLPTGDLYRLMFGKDHIAAQYIKKFFTARQGLDMAVDILDLTMCLPATLGDMAYLESCTNLKVVWSFGTLKNDSDSEYICGSGHPEKIDFRRFGY